MTANERASAEKRLWQITNLQACHPRKPGALEALALFHNQNLITIELLANALDQPLLAGPASPESPLRGLRTKDRIHHHPALVALKKLNELLEATSAPDDVLKQGETAVAILTEAYTGTSKITPYDGRLTRALWIKDLGLEATEKVNPGELLYEGARKKGLIPNEKVLLKDADALAEASLADQERLWTKLCQEKGRFNSTYAQLTDYLEKHYQRLEQACIKPLHDEATTWCKATAELTKEKKELLTDYLKKVAEFADTQPLLEGQTLNHAAQTTLCQIATNDIVNYLTKLLDKGLGKGAGALALKTAEAGAKSSLKLLGAACGATAIYTAAIEAGNFLAPFCGKESGEDLIVGVIADFVKDAVEKSVEKWTGDEWIKTGVGKRVDAALDHAGVAHRGLQDRINQEIIPALIKGLSPAGKKCALTIAELCAFCNSPEGYRSFSPGLYREDNHAAPITFADDESEKAAQKVAETYIGWRRAQDPGNPEGYQASPRHLAAVITPNPNALERDLGDKSSRFKEIFRTARTVDYALKNKDTAASEEGSDALKWVHTMHAVKHQANPFEPHLTLRGSAIHQLYAAAKADTATPGDDSELHQLHTLAYLLGLRPDVGPLIRPKESLHGLHKRLLEKGPVQIPGHYQTADNLLTPLEGQTLLERIVARKGPLDGLLSSQLFHTEFLRRTFTPKAGQQPESVAHYLARHGYANEVCHGRIEADLLEEKGANGRPILFDLVDQKGDFFAFRIQNIAIDPCTRDQAGLTLIAYAAKERKLETLTDVIVTAEDLAAQDHHGSCALHWIAKNGDWELLKPPADDFQDPHHVWDISLKAEHLLIADKNGVTPLKLARANGSTKLINQDILATALTIERAINCVEPVTKAAVRWFQGEKLSPIEKAYFPNGQLHPLLINRLKGNDPEAREFKQTWAAIEREKTLQTAPQPSRDMVV